MRVAGTDLQRFGRELRDVRVEIDVELDPGSWERTFDVWFDNLFSDLRVRERIGQSPSSVAWAIDQVERALDQLPAYTDTMLAELRELRRERERIVVDGYR